jgi:hypothetical protein
VPLAPSASAKPLLPKAMLDVVKLTSFTPAMESDPVIGSASAPWAHASTADIARKPKPNFFM